MVPYYYLIKSLGMMNTIWVMIIPGAIDTFNMLLMRNYFASLPAEMEESAKIDGANDLVIFVKIFLPLSLYITLSTEGLEGEYTLCSDDKELCTVNVSGIVCINEKGETVQPFMGFGRMR